MARTRQLRPSFFTSPTLAKCARDARLLFAGLWVEADDAGRLIDAPKRIAGSVFPLDDDVSSATVTGWIDQLEAVGAVKRYRVGDANLLVIPGFIPHQRIPHAAESTLPAPPEPLAKRSRKPRAKLLNDSRETPEQFTPSVFVSVPVSVPVSSSSFSRETPPDAGLLREEEEEELEEHEKRQTALVALAEWRLEQTTGIVKNPEAWLNTTIGRLEAEYPNATAEELLAKRVTVGGAPESNGHPGPLDTTQAARQADYASIKARRDSPCPGCDGVRRVEDDEHRWTACVICAGSGVAP